MSDELEVITDEKFHEQFVLVHRLKGEVLAFRAPSQESQSQFGLSFEIEQHGQPVRLAVLTGRQALSDLARLSRTRFPWTQNWLNQSVQGGPEHDR